MIFEIRCFRPTEIGCFIRDGLLEAGWAPQERHFVLQKNLPSPEYALLEVTMLMGHEPTRLLFNRSRIEPPAFICSRGCPDG